MLTYLIVNLKSCLKEIWSSNKKYHLPQNHAEKGQFITVCLFNCNST